MKALTVRQPWATLLVMGVKRIETRTRDDYDAYRLPQRYDDGHWIWGDWEPCALDGKPTPATTCPDCGTTRTICDAGLNTYDTRCCEQCGHREGK